MKGGSGVHTHFTDYREKLGGRGKYLSSASQRVRGRTCNWKPGLSDAKAPLKDTVSEDGHQYVGEEPAFT